MFIIKALLCLKRSSNCHWEMETVIAIEEVCNYKESNFRRQGDWRVANKWKGSEGKIARYGHSPCY